MEKALRPNTLQLDPAASADGRNRIGFLHWRCTLQDYMTAIKPAETDLTDEVKFKILTNNITSSVYSLVMNETKYSEAMKLLENVFIKTNNANHARYMLATRRQQEGETVKQFHLALQNLARDCEFTEVTAVAHAEESIRTTFIAGLGSNEIRKRLLENTCSLSDSLKTADAIEEASRNSKLYGDPYSQGGQVCAMAPTDGAVLAATGKWKCFCCGSTDRHPRRSCPALNSKCESCSKKGHWASMCRSDSFKRKERVNAVPNVTHLANPAMYSPPSSTIAASSLGGKSGYHVHPTTTSYPYSVIPAASLGNRNASADSTDSYSSPYLASMTPTYPPSLGSAVINVKVNSHFPAYALVDTGSTLSFISKNFIDSNKLRTEPCSTLVTMATESNSSKTLGLCRASLSTGSMDLGIISLLVLDNLCADIILGHDLLQQHKSVSILFNGPKLPIDISAVPIAASVAVSKLEPVSLFSNLTGNVRPIACSSRKFSTKASEFIAKTVDVLSQADIIRPSRSSWRAQVLVTGLDEPKPRMVVDYSRTINKFTQLDAFPLPSIESTVAYLAQFTVFSSFDLKSAYYQVPILESEKHYTAFEAAGQLWEFNVIPPGATNAVAAFQRTIHWIIEQERLLGTAPYLDDITVGGDTQMEHDNNSDRFLQVCRKYGLTLNNSKTVLSVRSLRILGYLVSKGCIKPDPERLKPLLELPVPHDKKSLQRVLGLFAYYSKWVGKYSDMIHPLTGNPDFPLSPVCRAAFETIKQEIANSAIVCPNEDELLVLESDASDHSLSASLNQGGRPVAFFSRKLKKNELRHHAMEKEACAVVEACRRWNHYLVGRKFLVITDQQAVSYMFDLKHHGRVKNDKIMRWRIELSALDFDIKYRPGSLNVGADCLSRAFIEPTSDCTTDIPGLVASTQSNRKTLAQIHNDLVHPGVVRLQHFVRTKNLPFSLEEIKEVCRRCQTCAEIKPQFFRPSNAPLIEATKPLDRLSIDFKGAIPSVTHNRYLFVAVDEYSRYVWAFPCSNMETKTVIRCLMEIFTATGIAGFVHSDRGPSLISSELRTWFTKNGIAFSNSAKYNPRGNGQVERFNGVVWRSIQLSLRSKGLPDTYWEHALPDALHSQRSLLCTATNCTPHERLYNFERRSASGATLPTWLLEKGPVLVRQHARRSKYSPVVTEVELVEANPQFAKVRYPCGRVDSVSLRDLAPLPRDTDSTDDMDLNTPGPVVDRGYETLGPTDNPALGWRVEMSISDYSFAGIFIE